MILQGVDVNETVVALHPDGGNDLARVQYKDDLSKNVIEILNYQRH